MVSVPKTSPSVTWHQRPIAGSTPKQPVGGNEEIEEPVLFQFRGEYAIVNQNGFHRLCPRNAEPVNFTLDFLFHRNADCRFPLCFNDIDASRKLDKRVIVSVPG